MPRTSLAPRSRSPTRQFALRAKAPPGNPYNGHTLAYRDPEEIIGNQISRILA